MTEMLDQLQTRLTELKNEFEMGEKMLTELETKQARLKETLLRISGAIQLLEELIAKNTSQVDSDKGAGLVPPR